MDAAQAIARRGGIAFLAATLTLVVCTVAWPAVLVLGDDVASAGDAAVGLFWAGLALLVLARVLGLVHRRRHASGPDPVPGPSPQGAPRPTPGRRLTVGLLVVGAGVATAFSWAFDTGSTSVVVNPSSAGGCRVVVQERSFLLSGSGAVFVLPAHGVVARRVSRYSTDDGYRPVAAGSFTLTWAGERGHLEVSGSGVDPVWPRSHDVACPGS
ncbi:hypothetical protein [Terrabacter sp. 2YAF2]|uniref:hypothetical protein n=1 Tax=Terrabacter sp. 2YAF2 TaxID=3233026 RepID=UPI003F9643CD